MLAKWAPVVCQWTTLSCVFARLSWCSSLPSLPNITELCVHKMWPPAALGTQLDSRLSNYWGIQSASIACRIEWEDRHGSAWSRVTKELGSHRRCDMMTSSNGNIFRVTGEFPSQRSVTRSFDVFFDLHQNKRLGKQSIRRWIEMPSRSLLRHCNESWNHVAVLAA